MSYDPAVLIPANEPCPLPDDPILAAAAEALDAVGQWAYIVDADWNAVYYTYHQRSSFGLGVERVSREDGAAIGVDRDRVTYTQLAELPTATEKARRDAPMIAVCEL